MQECVAVIVGDTAIVIDGSAAVSWVCHWIGKLQAVFCPIPNKMKETVG